MEKYLITTANEYGDANHPVILCANDINDAVNKFQRYVIDTIDEEFTDIDIDTNKTTADIISELRNTDGVSIEPTLIHVSVENDNGDSWTEWNLYDLASLVTLDL